MEYRQKVDSKPIGKLLQDTKPDFLDKRRRLSVDFTFYGITPSKQGMPEIAISFKIIKASGAQIYVQYHELISPMEFDGASTLSLATPNLAITITGKNLGDLADYFGEHWVMWMKEPDSDFMQVKDGEVEIQRIEVKEI